MHLLGKDKIILMLKEKIESASNKSEIKKLKKLLKNISTTSDVSYV